MVKGEQSELKVELLLGKLVDELGLVNRKLDSLVEINEKMLETHEKSIRDGTKSDFAKTESKLEVDTLTLLTLPTSLRKTVIALYRLENATAEDIAKETKRLRAVESASANQLVRMGYVKKKREGRIVYFYIESPMEMKK
jgi:hypothetical protein